MQYFTLGLSDVLKEIKNTAAQAYVSRILLIPIPQYLLVGCLSTLTLLGGPPIYSLTEQTWLFFWCAGGPSPVTAPLPPLQAAPVPAGRRLAAHMGGNASGMQSWEYKGVRPGKEEPSQGDPPGSCWKNCG